MATSHYGIALPYRTLASILSPSRRVALATGFVGLAVVYWYFVHPVGRARRLRRKR